MFDTIILLTGPAEHSVFATMLRGHNPALHIVPIFIAEDLNAIEPEWLARARLISIKTSIIVPAAVLDQLGYAAYNFHPGPPQRPGRTPAHFAHHARDMDFGCTVHRMTERVHAGPIVEVDVFSVPPDISADGLEEMAYAQIVQMFWRMSHSLATQSTPLIERALRWGHRRNARTANERVWTSRAIAQDELRHRIDAVGADHLGIVPSIESHGFEFQAAVLDACNDRIDPVSAEA